MHKNHIRSLDWKKKLIPNETTIVNNGHLIWKHEITLTYRKHWIEVCCAVLNIMLILLTSQFTCNIMETNDAGMKRKISEKFYCWMPKPKSWFHNKSTPSSDESLKTPTAGNVLISLVYCKNLGQTESNRNCDPWTLVAVWGYTVIVRAISLCSMLKIIAKITAAKCVDFRNFLWAGKD